MHARQGKWNGSSSGAIIPQHGPPDEVTSMPHFHCPEGCENPQPIPQWCGMRLCGRCYFVEDRTTIMYLCTPEVCGE